jgi:hypothetical protein
MSINSTRSFWMSNDQGEKLPHLKELAIILNKRPSSRAYIERYFSICGFFCTKRSGNLFFFILFLIRTDVYKLNNFNGRYKGNMKSDLIEQRCLLKTNINILEEMSERLIIKN